MLGYGLPDYAAEHAMEMERREMRNVRDVLQRKRTVEVRLDVRQRPVHPLLVGCRGIRPHDWNRIRSERRALDFPC